MLFVFGPPSLLGGLEGRNARVPMPALPVWPGWLPDKPLGETEKGAGSGLG